MNKQKIVIILAATLLAAIIIIVVFVVLIKKEEPGGSAGYNQYIENLKKQGAGANGQNAGEAGQPPDEVITYSGQLIAVESGLEGKNLSLKDSQTGQAARFSLNSDTVIIYGTKQLQITDLHAGDELRVTAKKNPDGQLVAKTITVAVSTSPTVPTQVNVPVETPGVILPPSKRNIL